MNNTKYLEWLCDRVHLDMRYYHNLATAMYEMSFEWPGRIHTDVNRASDGINLRDTYEYETGEQLSNTQDDCSVLEMFVAFSERIDDIAGEPDEIHYDKWFHEMMRNLELNDETDDYFDENEVRIVLYNFMLRHIDYDGKGGAFPIRNPFEDQRDLSLWDQMSNYLNENY